MTRLALLFASEGTVAASAGNDAEQDWNRARTTLWTLSAAGMLALHLGAIVTAVLWLPRPAMTPPPPDVMVIDMAPPEPHVVPAAEKVLQPDPPMNRQTASLGKVQRPPVPLRKAEVTPPPKPRTDPLPSIQPANAAAETVPASVEPVAEAAPPAKAVAPAVASTPPSDAVVTWQSRLLAHLERYKRYPTAARAWRQEGVTTIRFVMDRAGTVVWSKLERSAGYASLDEEGLALLERAQPLPPPPPSEAGERIELVVPIQFFLKAR